MKKKFLGILICIIFVITGCNNKQNDGLFPKRKETFMYGHTLDDGRLISFTFEVPYKKGYLNDAFINDEISIEQFINQLNLISGLNDCGSNLYKYNKNNGTFGKDDFYVLVCNSCDNIKDIFVAKDMDSLKSKCNIKIDDLDGVTITIKKGTLTNTGVTIIIKDVSARDNIYGESYRIDKFVNGKWEELDTIIDNYGFNSIGYKVDKNNELELKINWEWLYGKLKSGKYRIVKDTSEVGEGTEHYITVEFEID